MEKRSIKEIKLILEEIQTLSDERLTELRSDERKGVQDLIPNSNVSTLKKQYVLLTLRKCKALNVQLNKKATK